MKGSRLVLFLVLVMIVTLAAAGCSAAATPSASSNKGIAPDASGGARESLGAAPPGAPVPAAAPAPVGTVVAGGSTSVDEHMIIKTGSFTMIVKNVQESLSAITALAEASGGYVMSSSSSMKGELPYANIVIKVPVTAYEGSMASLRKMAVQPPTEISNGQDVTEEFADVDSQVRNLRATETQLLAYMQKAQTIDEILKVQAQLTNIRGQIERLQGRLQYLSRSAAMSTITVNLQPFVDKPIVQTGTDAWQPGETAKSAARALVVIAQRLADLAITLIILSPLFLIPLAILWIAWKLVRRLTRSK